jgi:hypothetical protein
MTQDGETGGPARARALLLGYRASCLLAAAVEVGLVDRLLAGPAPEEDLARELPADLPCLRRFLRALLALGIVERRPGTVALSAEGRGLADLRDLARLVGAEYLPAWGRLAESVRTGEPAFERVFGVSAWRHREEHPDLDAALQRTLEAKERGQMAAVLDAVDLSGARRLVDAGGGHGADVVEALRRHTRLEAVLLERPALVEGARARLAAAGLSERCRVVGGSFFESVPEGGDVYLLKRVLHDWDDARCVAILQRCREAMRPSSALLVVENVLPEETGGGAAAAVALEHALLDVHMMAIFGGAERTLAEYDALLGAAGLARVRRVDAGGLIDVIEARRA